MRRLGALVLVAIIMGSFLPSARAVCPYMFNMWMQMQHQQRHMVMRQAQTHAQQHQNMQMNMQRQVAMQQQMRMMQQRQMAMRQQVHQSTQLQMRMHLQIQRTTAQRSGQVKLHMKPAGQHTGPIPELHARWKSSESATRYRFNPSIHLVRQRTVTRRPTQHQQRSLTRSNLRKVTPKYHSNHHQTGQRHKRENVKHKVATSDSAKMGATMQCGNCHGCQSQPPPTLTQQPLPVQSVMPNLKLQPMVPIYRPTLPLAQVYPGFPALQMLPTAPRATNPFDMLLQPRPYRPNSVDLALERLKPKSSDRKTREVSPKSTLGVPELPTTPFLPSPGSDGTARSGREKPTSLALPRDLIVPVSAALLAPPRLPEMPEHGVTPPALPPLPGRGRS